MNHLKPFGQYQGSYYYGNFGAGVLPICSTTKRMLLGYRGIEANEPHTWGIFGGKADEDETLEDLRTVALRELYEETKYKGEIELTLAHVYKDKKRNFEYHNFIGIVEEEFTPILDWENENAQWFTYEEVLKMKNELHFGLYIWIDDLKKYYHL